MKVSENMSQRTHRGNDVALLEVAQHKYWRRVGGADLCHASLQLAKMGSGMSRSRRVSMLLHFSQHQLLWPSYTRQILGTKEKLTYEDNSIPVSEGNYNPTVLCEHNRTILGWSNRKLYQLFCLPSFSCNQQCIDALDGVSRKFDLILPIKNFGGLAEPRRHLLHVLPLALSVSTIKVILLK